jgi:hypothetical protein
MQTAERSRFSRPPDTILHIGTGSEKVFTAYGKDARITLIEPNEEAIAVLRRGTDAPSALTVVHAGAGRPDQEDKFRVFNILELSSFCDPSGILRYYPGLRLLDTVTVKRIAITEFLDGYETVVGGENLLIIDVAGDEGVLLEELKASGGIDRFQMVEIYCGENPWYEGSLCADEISATMARRLFQLTRVQSDHWGRQRLEFRPDRLRRRLREQKMRLLELERRLKDSSERARLQDERISNQVAEIERLSLRLDDALLQLQAAQSLRASYEVELLRLEDQLDLLRQLLEPVTNLKRPDQ